MFKKLTIAAIAVLLVGGLLFGRNLVPYATTAFDKVKQSVNDSIPVEHQIEAAEKQLRRIDPQIKSMRYEIAKETVAVKRLSEQIESQQAKLENQYGKIMTLRDHLESGDTHYVAKGRAFNTERVQTDLANRFKNYKTAESTVSKLEQIVELREQGLVAADAKLKETIAQQQELEIQVENLRAQLQMLQVAETANKIHIDNSQLSRTQKMIDDIEARIEVRTEVMNLTPDNPGIIPVGEEDTTFDGDIVNEIDSYFKKSTGDDVVSK